MPPGSIAVGENGVSDGDGGRDDRVEFLDFCAEMDGPSGQSSSFPLAGQPVSPELVVTKLAEPALSAASNDEAAGELLLPTSPDSTATGEDVGAPAIKGSTHVSRPLETDESRACGAPGHPPSTGAREQTPPGGESAAESDVSPQGSAGPCPPGTVLRSAAPLPPPLSPSPATGRRHTRTGLPETPAEESRGDNAFVPRGSSLKCPHNERRGGAKEGKRGIGPTLGDEAERGAQKKGTAANRGGNQPKAIVEGSQDNGEICSKPASKAKSNSTSGDITPEKAERSRCTSVDEGAAQGMPAWVVKPAANTNCGFGIQVCCSSKVIVLTFGR